MEKMWKQWITALISMSLVLIAIGCGKENRVTLKPRKNPTTTSTDTSTSAGTRKECAVSADEKDKQLLALAGTQDPSISIRKEETKEEAKAEAKKDSKKDSKKKDEIKKDDSKAKKDVPDTVEELLKKGAKIETTQKDCKTPLHLAVANERRKMVKLLISKGAKVDAVDNKGQSPLFAAVKSGNQEIIQELLDAKANVDLKDEVEGTALMEASSREAKKIRATVEKMIKAGANPKLVDKKGMSALSRSCGYANAEMTKLMIEATLDLEVQSKEEGWSPLFHCIAGANNYFHTGALVALLKANPKPEVIDKKSRQPINVAVEYFQTARVKHPFTVGKEDDRSVKVAKRVIELLGITYVEIQRHCGDLGDEAGDVLETHRRRGHEHTMNAQEEMIYNRGCGYLLAKVVPKKSGKSQTKPPVDPSRPQAVRTTIQPASAVAVSESQVPLLDADPERAAVILEQIAASKAAESNGGTVPPNSQPPIEPTGLKNLNPALLTLP